MSSSKVILKNLFSLSAAELSSRLLSVVYSIYLARALGVDGFGIFGASKFFTVFFMLFATFGLDAIGTREIAANRDKIKSIVNNILTIRIIIAIITYFVLVVIVYFIDKSLTEKLLILIFGLNILTNNTLLNWVFQGVERINIFAIRTIFANIFNFLGIIAFVHSPNDIIFSSVVVSGALIINSIWMFLYYIKEYGKFSFAFDFSLWKKYLKEGFPIGITFFIIGVYNYQGIVLLGFLSSNYAAGIFSAAFNVLIVTTLLSSIMQTVYYPIFAKYNDKERRKSVMKQFLRLSFSVGTYVPLFLFAFADKVVLLFGKDYSNSILSIRILMISALFIYYSITFFSPLLAWKYERKVIYANVTALIVNLVSNLILIPRFSSDGAAFASLLSEMSVFIVLSVIFYPIFKTLFLKYYLTYFSFAFVTTLPFLFISLNKYLTIILMIISFVSFIALNFYFKTITFDEIKKLAKK
jgi:O-antigen/teichoic acid export membrane protein